MAAKLPFTEDDLKAVAGPTSYARGLGYVDQVEYLAIGDTWVTATVVGSDAYVVRLSFGDARYGVTGDCSCPFGAEGNFCKHCVAAGLVALSGDDSRSGPAAGLPASRESIVSWLSSLTKDELLAELLELVDGDLDIHRRFELRAAARRIDVDGIRDGVLGLLWVDDYIDYDEAGGYAGDISRAADAIGDLIEAGAGAQAIDLARDAISWVRRSLEQVDDSLGNVGDAACELLDVHLLACQAAPPDPPELAGYLADQWLTDHYGLVPPLADYTELLGGQGTAALRDRVARAYRASPEDSRVRRVMEAVLEAEGDVDALVTLYAAHLDQFGWQHLTIVRKLDEAGRPDEALTWAERGVRECARPDTRLVAYVAGRYTAAGRADELVELHRMLFAADRTLANFRALRSAAIDADGWDGEREAVFGTLREDAAAGQRAPWSTSAGPVLVDALIDDGDLTAAWAAAADLASQPQWIRLADASVTERPADALAVYVKAIDQLTQHTGESVYRQIADHLIRARACHEALGTSDEFRQYMVLLRMAQKRKRTLMKILDQSGL